MKEEWVNDLNRFRKPLGKLLDRKLVNKQQAESAPEDPVGEYLIFQSNIGMDKDARKTRSRTYQPKR